MKTADIQTCPFCTLDTTRIIASNPHALAIMDGFPISPGHALIIPKRHIASLFEATKDEREALFDLLDQAKSELQEKEKTWGQAPQDCKLSFYEGGRGAFFCYFTIHPNRIFTSEHGQEDIPQLTHKVRNRQ